MKWSQLKKRIEAACADSVRGRVEVWMTGYRGTHDKKGEGWITIDKQRVQSMGTLTYYREHYLVAQQLQEGDENFNPWELKSIREVEKNLKDRGILTAEGFGGALFDYLNMSIDDILASDNIVIRALGMLDRRLGKRRLVAVDVSAEHPLVRTLYDLRCSAEGLRSPREQQP